MERTSPALSTACPHLLDTLIPPCYIAALFREPGWPQPLFQERPFGVRILDGRTFRSPGAADEGPCFGEEDLREVQGDPPQGRGARDLQRESPSQAAAGLRRRKKHGSYFRR